MTKYISSYGPRSSRPRVLVSQLVYPSKFIYFVIVGFAVALIVAYVFLFNDTTASSYTIRKIENRIEAVQKENKSLELKVAEIKSMKNVQARLVDQNFVPVSSVSYVDASVPSVAFK